MKKYIYAIIFLVVISLTYGFGAFNIIDFVSFDESVYRALKDIRVTGVSIEDNSNNGLSYFANYNYNNISFEVDLPNLNSTVTYRVPIINIGNVEMGIARVTGLPSNLDYEILNYNLTEALCDNTNKCSLGMTKDLLVKIKYKAGVSTPSSEHIYASLIFDFQEMVSVSYYKINHSEDYLTKTSPYSVNLSSTGVDLYDVTSDSVMLTSGTDYNINNHVLNIPSLSGNTVISLHKVKISFTSNGGTGTMSPIYYYYGDSEFVTIPEPTFTRVGYTTPGLRLRKVVNGETWYYGCTSNKCNDTDGNPSIGWYLKDTFSYYYYPGLATNHPTSLISSDDLILYPRWNPNTYTITFNKNGGTGTNQTGTATYDDPAVTATSFTNPTKSVTVTLNLNSSGATQNPTSTTVTGTAIPLGWSNSTSSTTLIASSDVPPVFNTDVENYTNEKGWARTSDTTLYAVWDTGVSVTLPKITKKGYTCAWYSAATGGTKIANSGGTYKFTANTTVYARCSIATYTLKYNTDGGTAIADQTYKMNDADFNLPNATKSGWTFYKWYTKNDGTGTAYDGGSEWIVNSHLANTTLYARYYSGTRKVTCSGNLPTDENSCTNTYGTYTYVDEADKNANLDEHKFHSITDFKGYHKIIYDAGSVGNDIRIDFSMQTCDDTSDPTHFPRRAILYGRVSSSSDWVRLATYDVNEANDRVSKGIVNKVYMEDDSIYRYFRFDISNNDSWQKQSAKFTVISDWNFGTAP